MPDRALEFKPATITPTVWFVTRNVQTTKLTIESYARAKTGSCVTITSTVGLSHSLRHEVYGFPVAARRIALPGLLLFGSS